MTPLFKKLNLKDQKEIVILNAPESFDGALKEIQKEVEVYTTIEAASNIGFIMIFVTDKNEIDALAPVIAEKLQGDGVLWFCYPKGTSKKYKSNFNRDTGWEALGAHQFEGVRMVAIDADWSALRFRRAAYIKKMNRSFAMSEEGKKKSGK